MTSSTARAWAIFAITSIGLAVIFFTLPIAIFDGQIHYIEPQRDYVVDAPLSLSYFIGIGYDKVDIQYVESFKLIPRGWIMAFLFIFGFPAILSYRIYLKSIKSE